MSHRLARLVLLAGPWGGSPPPAGAIVDFRTLPAGAQAAVEQAAIISTTPRSVPSQHAGRFGAFFFFFSFFTFDFTRAARYMTRGDISGPHSIRLFGHIGAMALNAGEG
jgi:hypothetical protein